MDYSQEANELTLSPAELAALAALTSSEELAPPPSSEEVFGEKIEKINKEFREDQVKDEDRRSLLLLLLLLL